VIHRRADASLGRVLRLAPLALLVLALVPAAASAQRLPANFFGVMINGPLDSPNADLMAEEGVMRQAGVQSQRVPFNWDLIQRDPNAAPDWSQVDRKVLAAAANGMSVLGLVLGSPPWASTHPNIPLSPPKDPGTYANFMRLCIARYGPFGSFWTEHPEVPATPIRDWQVWNEPNLSDYFSVQPFAKPYVRLLRAARKAIKSADPGATVVMAGLANFSWRALAQLYKAHVKGLFDDRQVQPPRDGALPRRPQAGLADRADVAQREGQDEEHPRLGDDGGRPGQAADDRLSPVHQGAQEAAVAADLLVHLGRLRHAAQLVRLFRPAPFDARRRLHLEARAERVRGDHEALRAALSRSRTSRAGGHSIATFQPPGPSTSNTSPLRRASVPPSSTASSAALSG
jgi:hypothetical protein